MIIYDPIAVALGLPSIHMDYSNLTEYAYDHCQTHRSPVNKGIPMSDEQKKLLSKINTGKTLSEEHKRKIGDTQRGVPWSDVRKQSFCSFKRGPASDETKEKMRQAKLGIKKSTKVCEYCHKSVAPNMYFRWHGEKCKLRKY